MVVLGFFGGGAAGALFLLIQLFCLSVNCLGCLIASCAMKGGVGSGDSVPLLLKIDILLLAIAFGLGLNWSSIFPKAVPSRDANCASAAILRTVGKASFRRRSCRCLNGSADQIGQYLLTTIWRVSMTTTTGYALLNSKCTLAASSEDYLFQAALLRQDSDPVPQPNMCSSILGLSVYDGRERHRRI